MTNYHNVQQDILETFVDHGQLRKLAEPTVLPSGKRIPGLGTLTLEEIRKAPVVLIGSNNPASAGFAVVPS